MHLAEWPREIGMPPEIAGGQGCRGAGGFGFAMSEFPGFEALRDVLAERKRQDAKWGEQNHDPFIRDARQCPFRSIWRGFGLALANGDLSVILPAYRGWIPFMKEIR
jgi:hypothetical protein